MKKIILLLVLVCSFVLASCNIGKNKTNTQVEPTPTLEEKIITIDEVINQELEKDIITKGVVVARNSEGFILKDNTNNIFVSYSGSSIQVALNDSLIIYGKIVYQNGYKINLTKAKLTSEISVTSSTKSLIGDKELNGYKEAFLLGC